MGMTQIEQIIENLTSLERNVLRSAKSNATGAKCVVVIGSKLHDRLIAAGLVGTNGGLTNTGANVRTVMERQQEEELFPL